MKKIWTSLCTVVLLSTQAFAQDSVSVLDVLHAPASPAASLIGTSPSDVQSFSDPSAFMISLQNATDNFTTLPKNYAVDIAPAWLFGGKSIKFEDYKSTGFKNTFLQSLVLSAAIANTNDSAKAGATDLGFSLKFSILRGKFSNKQEQQLNQVNAILRDFLNVRKEVQASHKQELDRLTALLNQYADNDSAYASIQMEIIKLGSTTEAEWVQKVTTERKEMLDSMKKVVGKVSFRRYGFKVDVIMGTAFDFPMHVYDSGYLSKAGAWLTAGWDDESGFSIQGIGRYLYNPDKIFADETGALKQDDLSTFDAGGKLQYENLKYNVTIGGEAVYRSVLNHTDVRPTWRCTFNADYAFQKNTHLTLVIGRDYDGMFNKDGTIITALNFIMGLGNGKNLK
jgi:hypothetical protein